MTEDRRPMTSQTILLFTGPLYEDLELWYPKIRLDEAGMKTVVAGLTMDEVHGKHGYPCTPDVTVDELRAEDFDGLVIPGGFAPDKLRRSAKVLELTREIFEAGKLVAFICHAGWVPISARIVKGKRGTSVNAIKDDLVNAGMLWEDRSVVVDGNMVTSRNPGDLPDFMREVLRALRAKG
jgi:protease I